MKRLSNTYLLLPLLVLVVSLSATVALWYAINERITERAQYHYRNKTNEIISHIISRLGDTKAVLQGGAALFNMRGGDLSGKEWHDYVSSLGFTDRQTGIIGFGYSIWLTPAQRETTVREMRTQGFPAYTIRPKGKRPVYTAIIWLEPINEVNRRAFGYDMYSEPIRRAAMDRARKTGQASVAAPVILLHDIERSRQSGMLMYLPAYRRGMPTATVEQRRAALRGFVYSPIRMNDFIYAAFKGKLPQDVDFEVSAGPKPSAGNLLFSSRLSEKRAIPEKYQPAFSSSQAVEAFGVTLHFSFRTLPDFEKDFSHSQAWSFLVGGTLTSLLLWVVAYQQARSRRQEHLMAEQMAERITERKQAVEAALATERQTVEQQHQLVRLLSHELRTPLAIIDSTAQVLPLLQQDPDLLLRKTEAIQAATRRLSAVFDNCLNAERLALEGLKPDCAQTDIKGLLSSICEQAQLVSGTHRIVVDLDNLPETFRCDTMLIKVLVDNLLDNAIKYSPDGGDISLKGWSDLQGDLYLEVKDSGIGIPQEQCEAIFKRFYRAGQLQNTPGVGLGLYLARHIAELHGGSISCVSEPGHGSTFTVMLPVSSVSSP